MSSTIQVYTQAITDFKRIQDSLANAQSKIGAESKANTFAELGDEIGAAQNYLLNMQRSERFLNSITEVSRTLETSYRAIDEMINVAIDFKKSVVIENSISSNINDLKGASNTALDSIRGLLNTREGANYIFGGSKTNIEPVSDLKRTSNIVANTTTANYYNGDEFKASVDVSRSLRVEYGVTAADSSIQNLIASVNKAKAAEGNPELVTAAGEQLETAINNLIALRGKMGNNTKILETATESHTTAKTVYAEKFAEINEADIVQLTIESSQGQAILQASFQNFSSISKLSLIEYI